MNRAGVHMDVYNANMRTNIVLSARLMRAAMRAAGTHTKRETVEYALKLVAGTPARRRAYARILAAAGTGGFASAYDVSKERRRARRLG